MDGVGHQSSGLACSSGRQRPPNQAMPDLPEPFVNQGKAMEQTPNERLERLTRNIARAGGIGEVEAQKIGSSPFLNARLRAGIESERRRQAELGCSWVATLIVASRAITVMAVVTIAAVLTLWFSRSNSSAVTASLEPARRRYLPSCRRRDLRAIFDRGMCDLDGRGPGYAVF